MKYQIHVLYYFLINLNVPNLHLYVNVRWSIKIRETVKVYANRL